MLALFNVHFSVSKIKVFHCTLSSWLRQCVTQNIPKRIIADWCRKKVMENSHWQASALKGAMRLNLRDCLTSKLDGYPADLSSSLRGQSLSMTKIASRKIAPAVHKIDSNSSIENKESAHRIPPVFGWENTKTPLFIIQKQIKTLHHQLPRRKKRTTGSGRFL